MQQKLTLKLSPSDALNETAIKRAIAAATGKNSLNITGYYLLKKSLDARARAIWVNLTLQAFINEPFYQRPVQKFYFKNVAHAKKRVVIIGAGPAGLFAALQLIEKGVQPIILERGKNVRDRRRDLAILNKEGIVNPESNYCFGEGGAGTYSDGKLYTRSNKRGDIDRILQLFVHFGADEKILYEAHPHIGTNKLPHIITAMRKQITDCGGVFLFEKKVVDFTVVNNKITEVKTFCGNSFTADAFILATGHSARDIFELLYRKRILIEAKPFALGVRVEHPQEIIDSVQYHCNIRDESLPPASYNLVHQVNNKGVFSFCMCPGGIIAPAATSSGELVVNGWSPSKRNNPYANSGMVVQVEINDVVNIIKTEKLNIKKIENNPLLMMQFQQIVEQDCYEAGGGNFVAPAQRMVDFCNAKQSNTLPKCSYLPGLRSAKLQNVLPHFIYNSLAKGFIAFGKKMKTQNRNTGFFTNEAIVVATESRTSSPVKIPRDKDTLNHPQLVNLYPCGEGAGYAGGIVSAAMDGERIALQLTTVLG